MHGTTRDHNRALQINALKAHGCDMIFVEDASGARGRKAKIATTMLHQINVAMKDPQIAVTVMAKNFKVRRSAVYGAIERKKEAAS